MRFKFCPVCGLSMRPFKEGRFNREKCSGCDWRHYHNARPTVSAIISRDGKVLLTQRAVDPRRGQWDAPGGFLEEREEPEEGLLREVEEELGVKVEIGRLIGVFGPTYYSFGSQDLYNLDLYYEAKVVAGEPRAQDDVAEIGWFSPDDLPEIAFPSVERAIRAWENSG